MTANLAGARRVICERSSWHFLTRKPHGANGVDHAKSSFVTHKTAIDLAAWTMFGNMEMRHEDIHRCSYVDLANRHPLGHSDRKRGSCVPGELRIRG
jgi:hypothetical protein